MSLEDLLKLYEKKIKAKAMRPDTELTQEKIDKEITYTKQDLDNALANTDFKSFVQESMKVLGIRIGKFREYNKLPTSWNLDSITYSPTKMKIMMTTLDLLYTRNKGYERAKLKINFIDDYTSDFDSKGMLSPKGHKKKEAYSETIKGISLNNVFAENEIKQRKITKKFDAKIKKLQEIYDDIIDDDDGQDLPPRYMKHKLDKGISELEKKKEEEIKKLEDKLTRKGKNNISSEALNHIRDNLKPRRVKN